MADSRLRLVAGIGSQHGDDRAGWIAARHIRDCMESECVEVCLATIPLDLIDRLDGIAELFVIDACEADSAAGTVHCLSWQKYRSAGFTEEKQNALPRFRSTHNLSLVDTLMLAEQLGTLPPHVELWGISACSFEQMSEPSSAVQQAAVDVAEQIVARMMSSTASTGSVSSDAATTENTAINNGNSQADTRTAATQRFFG